MSSPIERIYIARSEPPAIAAALRQHHEVLIDDGDGIDFVAVGNNRAVLFERKEASDLLRSFVDANEASGEPRVMAQLRRLQETTFLGTPAERKDILLGDVKWPILRVLLVERNIGQNRAGYATVDGGLIATKIPYNAIDNFLLVVQGWGFRVAHSTSLVYTPARIIAIAEGWLSTEDKEPILMLPKALPSQLRNPMTLPGVGIKRSKVLFQKFSNLRGVWQALLDGDPHDLEVALDKGVREKVEAFINKPITWTDRGKI